MVIKLVACGSGKVFIDSESARVLGKLEGFRFVSAKGAALSPTELHQIANTLAELREVGD